MVKFAQAYLIDKDCKMRYESITEYGEVVVIPSQARTSNLNEELVRTTRTDRHTRTHNGGRNTHGLSRELYSGDAHSRSLSASLLLVRAKWR